jgi:hypothetical protein
MSPTAIFNRFDLSASNGQHCGEYRVVYHKNNGNRFFLSFEAKYPNPEAVCCRVTGIANVCECFGK